MVGPSIEQSFVRRANWNRGEKKIHIYIYISYGGKGRVPIVQTSEKQMYTVSAPNPVNCRSALGTGSFVSVFGSKSARGEGSCSYYIILSYLAWKVTLSPLNSTFPSVHRPREAVRGRKDVKRLKPTYNVYVVYTCIKVYGRGLLLYCRYSAGSDRSTDLWTVFLRTRSLKVSPPLPWPLCSFPSCTKRVTRHVYTAVYTHY